MEIFQYFQKSLSIKIFHNALVFEHSLRSRLQSLGQQPRYQALKYLTKIIQAIISQGKEGNQMCDQNKISAENQKQETQSRAQNKTKIKKRIIIISGTENSMLHAANTQCIRTYIYMLVCMCKYVTM